MRASSLAAHKRGLNQLIEAASGEQIDLESLSEEFFSLAGVARSYPKLVVALTDPSREAGDKLALLKELDLDQQLSDFSLKIVDDQLGQRWSTAYDLIESWEQLGTMALIYNVKQHHQLEELSEELFSLNDFLVEHRDVRVILTDRKNRRTGERLRLAHELFAGQLNAVALKLLERAIITLSGVEAGQSEHRSLTSRLRYYQGLIAEQLTAQVVTVEVAQPLEEIQTQRLSNILQKKLGERVLLNVSINPHLIGGMRLQIGEKIYDASILSAITQTKQKMAG